MDRMRILRSERDCCLLRDCAGAEPGLRRSIRTPVSDVCEHAVWRQRICLITDLESRSEGMMFSELPDVAISTGDANAMSADGLLFLFAKDC